MDRATYLPLALAHEQRARQIREAAEHRRAVDHRAAARQTARLLASIGCAPAHRSRDRFTRGIGRSLIRLGHALAAEPEPDAAPGPAQVTDVWARRAPTGAAIGPGPTSTIGDRLP